MVFFESKEGIAYFEDGDLDGVAVVVDGSAVDGVVSTFNVVSLV